MGAGNFFSESEKKSQRPMWIGTIVLILTIVVAVTTAQQATVTTHSGFIEFTPLRVHSFSVTLPDRCELSRGLLFFPRLVFCPCSFVLPCCSVAVGMLNHTCMPMSQVRRKRLHIRSRKLTAFFLCLFFFLVLFFPQDVCRAVSLCQPCAIDGARVIMIVQVCTARTTLDGCSCVFEDCFLPTVRKHSKRAFFPPICLTSD
jgi:hypothetical protein